MAAKLAAVEKESGEQLTALQEENLNLKQRLQVPQMSWGTNFQPFTKVFVPTQAVLADPDPQDPYVFGLPGSGSINICTDPDQDLDTDPNLSINK